MNTYENRLVAIPCILASLALVISIVSLMVVHNKQSPPTELRGDMPIIWYQGGYEQKTSVGDLAREADYAHRHSYLMVEYRDPQPWHRPVKIPNDEAIKMILDHLGLKITYEKEQSIPEKYISSRRRKSNEHIQKDLWVCHPLPAYPWGRHGEGGDKRGMLIPIFHAPTTARQPSSRYYTK